MLMSDRKQRTTKLNKRRFYSQEVAVKVPRFRIASIMVVVAIVALDFGRYGLCL